MVVVSEFDLDDKTCSNEGNVSYNLSACPSVVHIIIAATGLVYLHVIVDSFFFCWWLLLCLLCFLLVIN